MSHPIRPRTDLERLLSQSDSTLACGAVVDELLERAAEGRTGQLSEHQRACPHCQAALAEFSRIWEPVRRLAGEPVSIPAAVKMAVSAQVRKLVADVWYTLHLTEGGAIRIAARVVAAAARDTARTVPGVKVALGRSTQSKMSALVEKATRSHRHPNAAVGVLGRTAVVDLAIAVRYGDVVDDVAREVQRRVIAELRSTIGLQDVTVNVLVDDVTM